MAAEIVRTMFLWSVYILLLLLLVPPPASCTQDFFYTVLAPKVIQPNSVYQLSASISNAEGPIYLELRIMSWVTLETVYRNIQVLEQTNETQLVSIPVGYLNSTTHYFLSVSGRLTPPPPAGSEGDDDENEDYIFEDTTNLVIRPEPRPKPFVLIQTDKPIYKPGETVRFRVLLLDKNLKPERALSLRLDVTIRDGANNVIKLWKNQQGSDLAFGLFSNNLTLSTDPVLGDWRIKAKIHDGGNGARDLGYAEKERVFKVDKYVLPKFNVELVLPPYSTFEQKVAVVLVKAAYTHGNPVKGEASVTLLVQKQQHSSKPVTLRFVLPLVNGTASIEVDLVKEFNLQRENDHVVSVSADVTERHTGQAYQASGQITVYKEPYSIKLIRPDQAFEKYYYKPGLPLTLTFQVSTPDGVPVADSRPDALILRHQFSYSEEGAEVKSAIPVSGLVSFTLETPSNEKLVPGEFEVTYKGVTTSFSRLRRGSTASKTYIQLSLLNQTSNRVSVLVKSNKPLVALNYVLVDPRPRPQIVTVDQIVLTDNKAKDALLVVKIPDTMKSSSIGALVVYKLSQHETIVESIEFPTRSAEGATNIYNNLNLSLSHDRREPGECLTLEIKSSPGSLVALRGIDQSVILVEDAPDFDIIREYVDIERLKYKADAEYSGCLYSCIGSGTDNVFEKAGLAILTNVPVGSTISGPKDHIIGGGPPKVQLEILDEYEEDISPGGFLPGIAAQQHSSPRVRKHFPETWIWEELLLTPEKDSMTLNVTVPDTITSWLISAYSLHNEHGLGVMDGPMKLTVSRKFFLTVELPYSVVQGELLTLKVLIHNYLEQDVDVQIILDNLQQEFQFLDNDNDNVTSDSVLKGRTKTVKVFSGDIGTTSFLITPTTLGPIELSIKAISNLAGDAISRLLLVKPPGHEQIVNQVLLIDRRETIDVLTIEQLNISCPTQRVLGADSVQLSIIPDILGAALSNLDNLLKLPYGCGEQNMMNFVPDVIVMDYLIAANMLTPEIKAKALQFLESGYQRQLKYMHPDGSFSAFGPSSTSAGSTWLTAFVIKWFIMASRYVTIDEHVIDSGLEYLARRQLASGEFQELGQLFNAEIAGGSISQGIGVTAYVLLTFLQSHGRLNSASKYDNVISNATRYLLSTPNQTSNLYALVLTCHALELAKQPGKEPVCRAVERRRVTDGAYRYWEKSAAASNSSSSSVQPLSIEMTSYQLLTLKHQGKLVDALPVVRWLLSKRNPEGGFASTQDTVVGLQALAEFAKATRPNGNFSLQILTNYEAEDGMEQITAEVTNENAIVLQQFQLPSTTKSAKFKVTGNGVALIQLTNRFYVTNPIGTKSFHLDLKVTNPTSDQLDIQICASYRKRKPSNMAVIEVNLPTGYAIDKERFYELTSVYNFRRHETFNADTKLNVYFTTINKHPTCISVYSRLVFQVAKQFPAYVVVYDYYDTTQFRRASYNATAAA